MDQFQSLKSLGMKNNSKVMVIGKKVSFKKKIVFKIHLFMI